MEPRSVVEPTCGIGHFLQAAAEVFPEALLRGFEVSSERVEAAQSLGEDLGHNRTRWQVQRADFYEVSWEEQLAAQEHPEVDHEASLISLLARVAPAS